MRRASIRRRPRGRAVTSPSACCQLRVESWHRCFRAVDWRASVSLPSSSFGVRQMHQGHHGKHHPLVTGGEIVQHLPSMGIASK